MQFFFDQPRNLLVYERPSPLVLEHTQGSKQLNGSYVAVPRTLRNSQILRWLNYPVAPIITDANYDWPIEPGKTPLAHQKIMANFGVLHPRMFNLSDMGCVAGETLIDTALGKQSIESLAKKEKAFIVRVVTNEGPRLVEVPAPFCKGRDALYRVTFQSGRSIVVTKRHVFLTSRGWTSCEQLQLGESLPVFDAYPQQSIWEPCHVKLPQGVQHLKQIISDSQGCYESPFYGAPPLSAISSGQFSIPSQVYALARTRLEWHTDVQGSKHIHTDLIGGDPRSKLHYAVRIDRGEMGSFLSECATKLTGNQFHICARYHLSPNRLQEAPEDRGLQLCIPLISASTPPFDTVAHIAYERTDVYYDMEVPKHANYVAHGLCNHNTMKTISTLWAADYLMRQHPAGTFRAIIVAPLSILERVWANAIFSNFLGHRTFEILHGSAEKRLALLEKPADFYIINFDGVGIGAHTRKRFELDGLSKTLSGRSDVRLAIVDEASGYRDATTKRHRIARHVIGKKQYLWLLTGTPTPNAPTDAYGLAKMVNNAFGKSFTSFREETMMKVSNFKWVPRTGGYDIARRLLTPSIRYDIKQVWDGPELTTQQRQVELTAEQKKYFADLKRNLQVVLKSGQPITAANEAAVRTKFIQISLGGIYDQDHKSHPIDAKPRVDELKAVLEQAPAKVIIAVPLTNIVDMLYKELKKRWSCEVVNGHTSQKDRSRIFQAFQEESDPRLLVTDPGCMAHGLDLYAAQTIVWFGPVDRTELYLQANKRAHRPGQRHPVTIVQLVSNKLEQEIYRRLETNTTLQGALLDLVREGKF